MKVSGTITDRTGILLALLATLYCITPIHNGNIFWHLRNGMDILETGEIRTADPFSWTMRGACWIQQEWLAETALALSWMALGEPGPVLLKALLVGLSVLLAYKAAIRNGGNPGFIFLFGAMWLILAQPRWITRPHFFTIFFFSFYLYMLSLKMEKPWKFALLLLPVQILWVNSHAGFILGIFLSAIPAMEKLFDGKPREVPAWLIPPAVLLLASGVHPNGFRSLEYLPSFLSQSLYKETIREWWSPFDPRYAPMKAISRTALLLISFTLVTAALTIFLRKNIVRGRIVALFILLAATVFAARNSELLAPAMLAWIPGMIALRIPRNAVILPALILAVIPFAYGVPREVGPPREPGACVDWSVYPVALADTLEKYPELMAESVVFNTNEISGYLQYRFGERLPLFLDGRCLIFPESLYRDYLVLAVAPDSSHRREQYDLINRYGFNLMMFNSWSPGSSVYLIADLPGWTPVYIDGLSAAYAENGLLSICGPDSPGFHYFDPLDPSEFLAKPLYLLPSGALSELLVQRDQLKSTVLDRVIQAIQFREGAVFPPIDDCCDISDYTLECWRNCREGNLDLAEQNALISGDTQLQTAVSVLQNGVLEASGSLMGIQLAQIRTEESAIVVEITALWITGQQDAALETARQNLQSLPGWGVGHCGLLYSLAGDGKTALELAELALSLARGPVVLERVGKILALEGRLGEAAERCEEALSLSPDFVGARLLLADCLWELCRMEEAGTEYDYILSGGHELPEYALNRLRLANTLSN